MGRRTNANDIELKATLQQLLLDLLGNAVETDMALGVDGCLAHHDMLRSGRETRGMRRRWSDGDVGRNGESWR